MSRLGGWHMSNKESYYPNIYENGYTFSRIENLSYIPHVHTGIECVCVLAGNLLATIDGRRYSLHKDDICFIMPYHRHSYLTRQTSDVLAFAMLSDEITTRNPFFSGKYDLPTPVFRSGKYSSHVNTLLGLLLDDHTRRSNATTHIGLLSSIVGYLFDAAPPYAIEEQEQSLEARVMLYLHDHLYKPITLLQAAEELEISQFRLSRICNQEIGIGFNAYLKSMRIAAAKRKLVFTDQSMPEIAESTGFESLRTFNRAFSEETNTTPRAYRACHKHKTSLNFRPDEEG